MNKKSQQGAIHFIGLFIIMAIAITGYIQFADDSEKAANAAHMREYCMELAKRGISTRTCEAAVIATTAPAVPPPAPK